ncbi:hypothetical protein ACR03S_18490 (plasmid) [Limimaricola variabilis]
MAEIDGGISIDAVGMSDASPLMIHPCEAEIRRQVGPILANLVKAMLAGNDPEELKLSLQIQRVLALREARMVSRAPMKKPRA